MKNDNPEKMLEDMMDILPIMAIKDTVFDKNGNRLPEGITGTCCRFCYGRSNNTIKSKHTRNCPLGRAMRYFDPNHRKKGI